MRLFGFELTRTKATTQLATVDPNRGWWPVASWWPAVRESYAGAWQNNDELRVQNVLTYAPVYACVTLIASDIAKLRVKLVEQKQDGIWVETQSAAFSPVLRKPNHFQNRIQFYQNWLTSKLIHGNTYVLKQSTRRETVDALYVLDPSRITVLVAPDGEIFYQLEVDNLAGLTEEDIDIAAPASEIIHDVMVPLYHPLCGVSPIAACAIPSLLALRIQNDSSTFFANGAHPGGILTAPNHISDDTAKRLKEYWNDNFSGQNAGKVAVLGDGLKFESMRQNAVDAQLIEQLKWTGEDVCTAFHVPPYKIGIGPPPNYNNIEALNQQYYSECLQVLIETIELLLDHGLGLAKNGAPQQYGTEFEVDDLLRMDTATRVKAAGDSITGGTMTINESRRRYHGLGPVKGGDTVYLQQQQFSVQALAERDANKPFAKPDPAPAASQGAPAMSEDDVDLEEASARWLAKAFEDLDALECSTT